MPHLAVTVEEGPSKSPTQLQTSAVLWALVARHCVLYSQNAKRFYRSFGGRHCSEIHAIHILSRCEGELAPTSATQYIFVILYGTFCLQGWTSLDGQPLMGQDCLRPNRWKASQSLQNKWAMLAN